MTPKQGDILIAINECAMEDTLKKTLTIGKEYEVISGRGKWFAIIDDDNDYHEFINDWNRYFKFKNTDTIVESVIKQFKDRSEVGIAKYGVTLNREDLSTLEWIQHLQEELMDAVCYIERLKQEFNNLK
jgi:hypothetical protein